MLKLPNVIQNKRHTIVFGAAMAVAGSLLLCAQTAPSGCASATDISTEEQQILSNIQADIAIACPVVVPTTEAIIAVLTNSPAGATAATIANDICTASAKTAGRSFHFRGAKFHKRVA